VSPTAVMVVLGGQVGVDELRASLSYLWRNSWRGPCYAPSIVWPRAWWIVGSAVERSSIDVGTRPNGEAMERTPPS
jgi:hypothetical protein